MRWVWHFFPSGNFPYAFSIGLDNAHTKYTTFTKKRHKKRTLRFKMNFFKQFKTLDKTLCDGGFRKAEVSWM